MLTEVGKILTILDGMDSSDQRTAIAVISARYGGVEMSSLKKTSKGSGGSSKAASEKKPSVKKEKSSELDSDETDFLKKVGIALKPVIEVLPKVTRQQGAAKPHMDLKSVQKRLNSKRRELQKELSILEDDPTESYFVFKSLNAIQAFRIAAIDAANTKGIRLPSDPIPEGFDQIRGSLKDLALELIEKKEVLGNGFFSDVSNRFTIPEGNLDATKDTAQDESHDSPW
jgi:hypothetical protein